MAINMNHYEKPHIVSISKEELNKKIIASASGCQYALCPAGNTFTCNTGNSYSCNNYSNGTNPCPSGYRFSCSAAAAHTDALKGKTA